jgi:GNAT superfamily N-acetyltransferase
MFGKYGLTQETRKKTFVVFSHESHTGQITGFLVFIKEVRFENEPQTFLEIQKQPDNDYAIEIFIVFVITHFQCQGYGDALINAVKTQHNKTLWYFVNVGMDFDTKKACDAKEFFEKHGFKTITPTNRHIAKKNGILFPMSLHINVDNTNI